MKEKAGGIDWHNSKRRVDLAKMRIQRRFSKDNTTAACRFLDRLRLDNMSYGRIENYSGSVIRILQLKDDKRIKDWSKGEIKKVTMFTSLAAIILTVTIALTLSQSTIGQTPEI